MIVSGTTSHRCIMDEGRRVEIVHSTRTAHRARRLDRAAQPLPRWLATVRCARRVDESDAPSALDQAPPESLRVVLLHHHVLPAPTETFSEHLADWVAPAGCQRSRPRRPPAHAHIAGHADLVLHGHRHAPRADELERRDRADRSPSTTPAPRRRSAPVASSTTPPACASPTRSSTSRRPTYASFVDAAPRLPGFVESASTSYSWPRSRGIGVVRRSLGAEPLGERHPLRKQVEAGQLMQVGQTMFTLVGGHRRVGDRELQERGWMTSASARWSSRSMRMGAARSTAGSSIAAATGAKFARCCRPTTPPATSRKWCSASRCASADG